MAGYLWLLPNMSIDTLSFLRHLPSASFLEYGRNYLLLAACLCGMLMLLFGSPQHRAMLAAALVLTTAPVWLDTFINYHMGAAGTQAIGEIALDKWPSILGTLSASFWGILMVRGPKKREWEKAVIGILMLSRVAFLTLRGEQIALSWADDAFVTAASLLIGAAADAVYNGPILPDLLVPLCACGWVGLSLIFPVLSLNAALYCGILASLVGATALICSKPLRRRLIGYIFAFAGIAASCASVLLTKSVG